MTAVFARRPLKRCVWILALLLLIFLQMFTSFLLSGGVFINSHKPPVLPFLLCLILQHGDLSCHKWLTTTANSEIPINILQQVVTIILYIPLVLVAFAWLSMLLGVYAKDRAAIGLSMALQAASSLLILIGLTAFLLLNLLYMNWEHMALWFYALVGVQVELVFLTTQTWVTRKMLPSDWE